MRVYSEQYDAECSVRGRCIVNVCVCEIEFVLVGGYFDLKLKRQYLITNSVVLCTEVKVEILQCKISFKSVLHLDFSQVKIEGYY